MSNKRFKIIDLPKEELAELWQESEEKRVMYQRENNILKKENKHWRYEAEKFERFWQEEVFNRVNKNQ